HELFLCIMINFWLTADGSLIKMKTQSILFTMVAALVTVGCGHHNHHRDHESLTGKVIKYPFRMTGYVIGAPFHPFESTRKAVNATLDIPEKAVSSTSEALFGHDHDRDDDQDHDDRDRDAEDNDTKSKRKRD
ncbi:MAG: hypothetical protein ACJ06V_02290, partial [Verrucomicrobiota bacterium]